MAKNRNLIRNVSYNFKLRKRPSRFIGTYIILTAFIIRLTINGFTTEASPFGFLTVNYLEYFIVMATIFAFLFSLLALFFGNRKHQRKIGFKIWNRNSKKSIFLLFYLFLALYFIEFYLLRIGEEAFIIPAFLISYGLILLILNQSKSKALYIFSMISIAIGFIPLFINGFGFYSLFIFGASHYMWSLVKNPFYEN